MLSPAIRPSRKGVTFANGTAKERPDGGTPIQSPPLVPWRVPHGHDFISEGITRVFGCEVGKRCEVPLLVSFADRRSFLAAQSESMRFEEAVPHECREDSVVVSGGLGVTMPLKEALHLLGTHARDTVSQRGLRRPNRLERSRRFLRHRLLRQTGGFEGLLAVE